MTLVLHGLYEFMFYLGCAYFFIFGSNNHTYVAFNLNNNLIYLCSLIKQIRSDPSNIFLPSGLLCIISISSVVTYELAFL
jgi:hypothetical protein